MTRKPTAPTTITPTADARQQVKGVWIEMSADYLDLSQRSEQTILGNTEAYPKARRMYELLRTDPRMKAHWNMANYIAVVKLGFNDHGPVHAQVATAAASTMMGLLANSSVSFDVVSSGAGDLDDAWLVVIAAEMMHDIGNEIHRIGHETYGVMLAQNVLDRLMPELYADPEQAQVITSFIASAIATHDCVPPPLTMEAAVVAVADGTDMTKGRGRIAFDMGKVDIHSVSALSIEEVRIVPGDERPVEIQVLMSDSAGIFQVQEILARKLLLTPLEPYITVRATAIDQSANGHIITGSVELRDRAFHVVAPRSRGNGP